MKKHPQEFTKILFRLMKITLAQTLLLAFFSTASFANALNAQGILDKPISLNVENVELKKALDAIERNTQVSFVFSSKAIQSSRKVTIVVHQKPLKEVLSETLRPLGIGYRAVGEQIVLNALSEGNVVIPVATLSGSVKDVNKNPLPGVNIAVKGTNRGTQSGIDGSFKVEAKLGDVLIFSYVGYERKEVTVESMQPLEVVLVETIASSEVTVVGSRFSKPRTDVERPVAIDVINANELQNSGQVDLGQSIHFAAPSFSAVKFGINDAAPFVDPASLRGLGPDQVLVLVNNKRRHKVSFVSINDGVGKGQVGTDVNVVPALSLKRVEILRDGAAAQYGSDAIAGVINMELNDASSGGAVNVFTGIGHSTPNLDVTGATTPKTINDGLTYSVNTNLGMKLAKKGYLNATITYYHTDGYDRSGPYKASAGFYVKDPVQDAALVKANNIDLDRAILGAAENTTLGTFINAGIPLNDQWKWYAFGGYTNKHVVTGVFTRPPSNARRSVLPIFPNGYNPVAPADLQDFSIASGIKGKMTNGWNADVSVSQGMNQVDWYAENTVNPSLGAASPTEFYIGQTRVTQSLFNADVAKTFKEGSYPNFSIGAGTELRYETYKLTAGDPESYQAGPLKLTKDVGSSGREGFSDKAAGKWNRTNIGIYTEAEAEMSARMLLGAAVRFENYSDFGSNLAYKANARYKIAEPIAIRGSVSRGFRAPSMTQTYYSNYVNISFDNAGNSIINPIIPASSELAKLLGVNGLKQETSLDFSAGITSRLGKHFSLTADVYRIDVDNRIMLSGSINVSKIPQFVAAGFPQTANVFVNAIDTRTEGLEVVSTYQTTLGAKSKLNINLAYSSMETTLRANRKTDTGIEVADKTATLYITDGLPKGKLIGSVNYEFGKLGLMLRASRFGEVSDPLATLAVKPTDPNAVTYQVFSAKTLADASLTFKPMQKLALVLGVNNLMDVYPDLLQVPQTTNEVVFSRRTNQFGTQGRFFNLTMNYTF